MSDSHAAEESAAEPSREELQSALFAQLVMQQANLAMMLMGKVPHPESGRSTKDLEAARLFIDQLEMLEAKTKGNLTSQESGLLKQSLMSLRMAFVEAVESPQPAAAESKPQGAQVGPKPQAAGEAAPEPGTPAEESHKKFTKKY